MTALVASPRRWLIHLAFVCLFLGPALYGFSAKFYELVKLVQGDTDGAFAAAPITNYLLASLGFACLFGWAAANGMFRDIERPKQIMLEHEAMLDAQEEAARISHPHNQKNQKKA